MSEREDANRTRAAGNRDEVEGVLANSLNLFRNGAVGFFDWLDSGLEKISSPSESYEDAKRDLELRGSFIHDRACVARKG
jgi:hypothetical protein